VKHIEKIIFLVCLLLAAGAAAWVFLGKSDRAIEAKIPTRTKDFELRPYRGREVVQEAGQKAEQFFQNIRRNLVFSEDSSSGRTVVSVVDSETGEIIRQIPPEQVVRIAESLGELRGLLVGERV